MNKIQLLFLTLLAAATLSACAMGGRREAMQQQFQFEKVDTNGDGSISRSEFDTWKTSLQGMRRGG